MAAEEAQTGTGTVFERGKEMGSERVCVTYMKERNTVHAVQGCAWSLDEKSSTSAVIYYYCSTPSPTASLPRKGDVIGLHDGRCCVNGVVSAATAVARSLIANDFLSETADIYI